MADNLTTPDAPEMGSVAHLDINMDAPPMEQPFTFQRAHHRSSRKSKSGHGSVDIVNSANVLAQTSSTMLERLKKVLGGMFIAGLTSLIIYIAQKIYIDFRKALGEIWITLKSVSTRLEKLETSIPTSSIVTNTKRYSMDGNNMVVDPSQRIVTFKETKRDIVDQLAEEEEEEDDEEESEVASDEEEDEDDNEEDESEDDTPTVAVRHIR